MSTPEELLAHALEEMESKHELEMIDFSCVLAPAREAAKQAETRCDELHFEWIAAELMLRDEPGAWGNHFEPSMTFAGKDGNDIHVPPLADITPECVQYWSERMKSARHPVLRSRYADLVWEFSKQVTGNHPGIEPARIAIDGYVDALSTGRCKPYDGANEYQERALKLASSINDEIRFQDAVRRLREQATSEMDGGEREHRQAILLGQLMRLPRRRRPDDELNRLATDLRARFDQLVADEADKFTLENLALLLAEYYRSTDNLEEAQTVLREYGKAVFRICKDAMAMLAVAWLRQLDDVYGQFEMNDDRDAVLQEIDARSAGINGELVRTSHSVEIPQEEFDTVIDSLVCDNVDETLRQVASFFLPKVKETEEQVRDLNSQFPLMGVFTSQIVTEDGRIAASVGSVEDDLDGHVVRHISQTMQFLGMWHRGVMEKAKASLNLTAADVVDWLSASPLFHPERLEILKRALSAYLDDDWVTTLHLAIPQIEHALRRFLVLHSRPTFRRHRNGGLILRNLDEVLRDPVAEQVLPEDVRVYFRVLLCDQRGWNIRNDVCHGIAGPGHFNSLVADRVVHALLVIGCYRPSEGDNVESAEEPEGGK